ncbi:MAG: hypothetical protein IT200_06925 [Thermoleophilia bacterium]|nr:hypothetical protein [Thermoleophilia bacterium]
MTLLICSTLALCSWLLAGAVVSALARLLRRPPPPVGRGLRARGGAWGRRSVYEQRREVSWYERN